MKYNCDIIPHFKTVQLRYFKDNLNVKQSTSNLTIYGETGRLPSRLHHRSLQLKYWLRFIALPDDNILHITYKELRTHFENGHKNWCDTIKTSLQYGNSLDTWYDNLNITNADINSTYLKIRNNLYSQYKFQWVTEINNTVKWLAIAAIGVSVLALYKR